MRPVTIARNYAEALFALGEKSGKIQEYADLIDAVAHGVAAAPTVQAVLMSPRVTKAEKARLFADALAGAPGEFVRFLQSVIRRGRQGLFTDIAQQFHALHDLKLNRVRAAVTVAHPVDEALRKRIADQLTAVMGRQVLPHFTEDPAILGGVVVKVGDRVFDGS
ncbi:MAG TPA: ATP synthase F1 subunit delta, partial [Gemmatimonadales bacterium]|nr:ATP synthase F1 subunit delta [Gemmatimonadales bacterium]